MISRYSFLSSFERVSSFNKLENPCIVDIGVLISWDTLLIKSFLSVSILFNSLTIELNFAVNDPISKSFGIGSCILKLPLETSPVA